MVDLKEIQNKRNIFVFGMLSRINYKFLVTIICFVFIGKSIYMNFESLSEQTINSKVVLWLLWAIVFSSLSIIINAYAWKLLIKNIGFDTNKLNILKLFLATNIYKYLPGGVWHFVSRFNTLRLELSTEKSIESILFEPLLMLVAGIMFIPFRSFNLFIYIICWSSTLVFLPGYRKYLVSKLKGMKAALLTANIVMKEKLLVEKKQNISKRMFYPYKPLSVEIVFIFFRFLGFFCCICAFSLGSLIPKGELISSFSLAWTIGFIVPAAPGGLGVFESVILFSLSSHLPEAPLLASLLCYRLVSTISDVCIALIFPVKKLFKV